MRVTRCQPCRHSLLAQTELPALRARPRTLLCQARWTVQSGPRTAARAIPRSGQLRPREVCL